MNGTQPPRVWGHSLLVERDGNNIKGSEWKKEIGKKSDDIVPISI